MSAEPDPPSETVMVAVVVSRSVVPQPVASPMVRTFPEPVKLADHRGSAGGVVACRPDHGSRS